MKPSHSQQAAFDKEEARIRMKREANEQRAKRFIDARTRTIGVDIDGLNQQCAEKSQSNRDTQEENRLMNIRAKEIDRVLENAVAEEKFMRYQAMQDVKRSWDDHKYEKSGKAVEPDYIPEKFGASSMQVFAGEDEGSRDRAAARKEQMKRWTQEKVAETAIRKAAEVEEDKQFAAMSSAIDEIRLMTEIEESDMRRAMKMNVADYNRMVTDDNARAAAECKEDQRTNPQCTSLHLEAHDEAETGVRRKDMFHGFTEAQLRRILQDNEAIRQIKIAKDGADKAEQDEWTYSQLIQQRAMEQAQAEEDALRKQNKLEHQANILAQRDEERARHAAWEADRRGAIEPEFFEKFGKSCR